MTAGPYFRECPSHFAIISRAPRAFASSKMGERRIGKRPGRLKIDSTNGGGTSVRVADINTTCLRKRSLTIDRERQGNHEGTKGTKEFHCQTVVFFVFLWFIR